MPTPMGGGDMFSMPSLFGNGVGNMPNFGGMPNSFGPMPNMNNNPLANKTPMDIDAMIKDIDNKIAEIEKEEAKKKQEIEKIQDQTQAEAEFNKSVAPLLQKENDEINKIAQPMMQAIHNAVETIRVEKKMDVVLDDPYTIRAADANSKIENITNEVISRLKK